MPAPMLLRYLHPIPRPYSHWTQLRVDARASKSRLYWLGGGWLIAFGVYWIYSHGPARDPSWAYPWLALFSILLGGKVLLSWVHKFTSVVRWTRTEPLDVGTIRTLANTHPMWRDLSFADAVRADGTTINVAVPRVTVDGLLNAYGECEVLFLERPWAWAGADSGFVVAARAVVGPGKVATDPVLHWTGFDQAKRLELKHMAEAAGYPIDAVFFVLSALGALAKRPSAAGPEGGAGHSAAWRLCQFIPEHAAFMFGDPARASKVLSAWGLRTGEDVGAIVERCTEAGWLKPEAVTGGDDFRGIDLPTAAGNAPWRSRRGGVGRGARRRPSKAARALRRLALVVCVGLCFDLVVVEGYVAWAERLRPEERPLVGRWWAMGGPNGEELVLHEYAPDRSFRLQVLRRGEAAAPAERDIPCRWAVEDGRIAFTPPLRGQFDRITRAFGRGPARMPMVTSFRTPDTDTLEMDRGNRRLVFRRVPAGLAADADLFPPRPADAGNQGP
ncbi:MAG: hypothetical protein U0746_21980 [Gemmataceae bacterium]